MEVSFFKRRKILKTTSALDLHPVRLLESEKREDECLDLLLPRFRNKVASKLFQPHWKERFIRIRLDVFGSAVWLQADGKRNTAEICMLLQEQFPGKFGSDEETQERVAKFLSVLYQQKFITFKELLTDSSPVRP